MYKKILLSFTLIATVALVTSLSTRSNQAKIDQIDPNTYSIEQVLNMLGEEPMIHSIPQVDLAKAKVGEDLIFKGYTVRDGKKSKRISNYFVCTDCHNMTSEFADISSQDASERLHYAKENGLPFLPGSTLWGIYNRTSFYNDDYVRKYGDLVTNARDTLANAVQLCSKYCASGRYIEDWELESIMHYFKKNELHVSDINIPDKDKYALINGTLTEDQKVNLAKSIKEAYVQGYGATFLETMPRNERPYGKGGNVGNGKLIYEKACMFCHENKRVTYLHLDDGKLSARFLWRNRKKYTDQSIYQIVRHGTYSKVGRKQYMPHFTKEKMSDAQLNDLVAYIKQIAKR
ncbi:MAG: cytochrome c [Crocinitomicaceae bacterium]|nr:cytochrome c [Crocinitomicaceae bacterium]